MDETRCLNCGENIEKDYILFINGKEFVFDSFECAVNFMAPRCTNCNCIIMDEGISVDGDLFCTKECIQEENFKAVVP